MMNANKLSVNFIKSSTVIINYQSVRHLAPRKPFWLGIAKSKITKVREKKTNLSSDEQKEFIRLKNSYLTSIKSLKKFIRETNPLLEKYAKKNVKLELLPHMQHKINASLENNNIFNIKSSELRCERLKIELQSFREEADKVIEETLEKKARRKELLEKIVKLEKIKSKTFITPENLEEAIEKCLNEEVEYNYAIDIKGNKYLGKEPLQEDSSGSLELNQGLEFSVENESSESNFNKALQSPI